MRFKHVLLEMSAASDRILGKDSDESILYYANEFIKLNKARDKKPTSMQFKKFMEEKGLDWNHVAEVLGISKYVSQAHMYTGFIDKFKDRIIEIQDDVASNLTIDEGLVNIFWEFYNARVNNDRAALNAFMKNFRYEFKELCDLVKNHPERAQEVFGKSFGKAKRWLAPWIVDDYENSPSGAIDAFWDWHRAKKAGQKPANLDKSILNRLADLLEMPDAVEIIGNKGLYFYVAKEVEKQLGIKILGPDAEDGLQKELKRIMRALDDPKYIDQIEREEKRRLASAGSSDDGYFGSFGGNFGGFIIPTGVLKKIVTIAAEPGNVDKSKAGKVDKTQVRECYKYCMNQLNRKFHVGERGAFEGTLQEFYDKFKIVFVRGFNIKTLFKIFDEVTTFMVDQLDKQTAKYWQDKEEVSADDDFNEAKQILKNAGFTLIAERTTPEEYAEMEQEILNAQAWQRRRDAEYRETGSYLEDIEWQNFIDDVFYKLKDNGYSNITKQQVENYLDSFDGTVDEAVAFVIDYINELELD